MPSRLDLWKPSVFSVLVAVGGVGVSLVGAILSAAMYVAPAQGQTPTIGSALLSVGLFSWGPAIVGFTGAALVAGRPFPRGLYLFVASAASLAAALFVGAGIGKSVGEGIGAGSFCCGLPTIATAIAGMISLYQGFTGAAGALRELRAAALADTLRGKRLVGFDELLAASGLEEADLPELLRQVLRVYTIRSVVIREGRCVLDADEDAAGRKKLLGVVRAQGRAEASALARELGVPAGVVTHWVHELAAGGEFRGALHGDTVFSEAALTAKAGRCPGCGSPLTAAAGLSRCTYCGTEVFG